MFLLPRLILVSGKSGAGKDFISEQLAARIGFKSKCYGNGARAEATRLGMSIEKWVAEADIHPEMNDPVDLPLKADISCGSNMVITSRLGHIFAQGRPDIIKILLVAEDHVRWWRIANRDYKSLPMPDAYHKSIRVTSHRDEEDISRFSKLCHLENYLDPKGFDFLVPNNGDTAEPVVQYILQRLGL